MTLTFRLIATRGVALICATYLLITGCSGDFIEAQTATVTIAADGGPAGPTDWGPDQPPRDKFARAGTSCGSCGGSYRDDGTCSIDTPANLGSACDLGSGKGACANGGTIVCGGTCQPADPAIGDATAWHLEPAPTGSWDWDCDGTVTTTLHPSPAPSDCATFGDSETYEFSPVVEYVAEDAPCGQQATLFKRDCGWKTLGPTCLNTPAGHRVVFQQCR